MDFLTARLTGTITATQKTMAPFVLVNNRRWGERRYSRTLLKMAGLDAEKFPDLLENDGMAGTLLPDAAAELGLAPGIPVICGVSDSNASVVGSGAAADFDSIIYIGTSLYMTCHVPFLKTDLIHMLTAIPSPFPDTWMVFGEQGAGGKCVEFFLNDMVYARDGFQTGDLPPDAYLRFNESAAAAPPGSGGVLFLPWMNGSVVPCEDPHARGGFINISFRTRRSHLARAVMEGIAFNNRWTMGAFQKFIGRPVGWFRFSGGGALSDLWAQIHADVLGVPIHQVEDPAHATVRGAGLLAFAALKMLSRQDISKQIRVRRVFEPDTAHRKIYDRNYQAFRAAFVRNRKIFKALNA
jgi:xylulokinase